MEDEGIKGTDMEAACQLSRLALHVAARALIENSLSTLSCSVQRWLRGLHC